MRALPALLALSLLLAACGAGTQPGSGSRSGANTIGRGAKGESPGLEAAGSAAIGRSTCAALARELERRAGVHGPRRRSDASPPLSRCSISGRGVAVNVYLDTGFAAHQRYSNRMQETAQFGAPDPRKLPHPVPGVGEPAAGNHTANWVPAYHSLFALRGNRWVTVAVRIVGRPERQLRAIAIALARATFRATA
ncbi:MAG TPA: hypothetical protein VF731_07165 [Solirubrobacterales bacterium]